MKPIVKRLLTGALLGAGIWALASQLEPVWSRDNRLLLPLPKARINLVELELRDEEGDLIRQARLFANQAEPVPLEYTLSVPRGRYRLELTYRMVGDKVDKSHEPTWTGVGVVHQIRLEGGTHRILPPPEVP